MDLHHSFQRPLHLTCSLVRGFSVWLLCFADCCQDVWFYPGRRGVACQSYGSEPLVQKMLSTWISKITIYSHSLNYLWNFSTTADVPLWLITDEYCSSLLSVVEVSKGWNVFVHFLSAGPKGVINDWRRFKLDSVDQTVPQSKRELLRQMSSPREDDKERLNRKVGRNTHWTSHTGNCTIDRIYS